MSYHAHNGVGAAPHVAAVALRHLARHAGHGHHAGHADRFARLHLASALKQPSQVTSMTTVAQMMAQDAARPKMVAVRSASQRLAPPKPHAMSTRRETAPGRAMSMKTVAQMMAQDAARPQMVAARSASQRLAPPKPHAMSMKREMTLSGLGTLPPFGGWGSAVKRLRMVGGNYFF